MAWDRWSDGRKDGSKKWHTEMGATPKKSTLIHVSNVADAVEKADKKNQKHPNIQNTINMQIPFSLINLKL